jgi:uncharacterized membrane protein
MSASAKSSRSGRTATNQSGNAISSRAKGGQGGRTRGGQGGRTDSGQPARNGRGGGQAGRPDRGGQGGRQVSQATSARQPVPPAPQPGVSWRFWTWPRAMGWLPFTTLVLAVIGLADSAYQVYTHYSGTGLLGCSATGDSCVAVQTSSYAFIFGIPVAVLGLAFYVFMVAACSPWAWRAKLAAIRLVRLASVIIGILFVLYLIYREVISLGKICAYCTSVHIITFLLFALIVFDAAGIKSAGADSPPARR